MGWHGSYYRGAMRAYRAAKREQAQVRRHAERTRERRRATCRKARGYRTYGAAALALVDCKIRRVLRGSVRRREQRIYACRDCGLFHLTSQPSRQRRRAEGIAA